MLNRSVSLKSVRIVVAKSEESAKQLVVDYYAQTNDGYAGIVTMHDLDVNGPVDPENYGEETLLD